MGQKRTWPMTFQEWHSGRGGGFVQKLREEGGFDAHSETEFRYDNPRDDSDVDTYDFSEKWEGTSPIHVGARHIAEDYMIYRSISRKKGHEPGEFVDYFHEDDDPEA